MWVIFLKTMNEPTQHPLVVTLALDEKSQRYFDQLRETYFPKERNWLRAHLTLFHQLPGEEIGAISQTLDKVSQQNEPPTLQVTQVKSIGRGVAFVLKNEPLMKIHRHLLNEWEAWLTPQDQQKLWPHITIQNKVTAEKAQQTLQQIAPSFEPFTAKGTGLSLWKYLGGPWEFVQTFPFA